MSTTAAPTRKSSSREENVRRARQLERQGLDKQQIAQEMGADITTVYTWLRKGNTARASSLNRLAWVAFVQSYIAEDEQDGVRVNGHTLSQAHTRALFRWTRENCNPGYFSADDFCIAVGLHIEMFFAFCEHHTIRRGKVIPRTPRPNGTLPPAICPWANGEGPAWYNEDWDDSDPRCLKPALRP